MLTPNRQSQTPTQENCRLSSRMSRNATYGARGAGGYVVRGSPCGAGVVVLMVGKVTEKPGWTANGPIKENFSRPRPIQRAQDLGRAGEARELLAG